MRGSGRQAGTCSTVLAIKVMREAEAVVVTCRCEREREVLCSPSLPSLPPSGFGFAICGTDRKQKWRRREETFKHTNKRQHSLNPFHSISRMASLNKYLLLFIIIYNLIALVSSSSSPSSSLSPVPPPTFLVDLERQCIPISFPSSSPPILQMDGESLDRALSSGLSNVNTAILFYASWCPFSSNVRPKFAALSSMFPQIKHIMVEQSSALPSVFSRHGIHRVPSILIVNPMGEERYHGPKDLFSLVNFYKRTAGTDPVVNLSEDELGDSDIFSERGVGLWNGSSLKEIFRREPYLVLSILFLLLKGFLHVFPQIMSNLTALWLTYVEHLNLGILGESRQLLGRVLQIMDVKRVFNKLKHIKSRNFDRGAKSARVWASSLASVSLGETSLARASPSASHGGGGDL